MTQVTDSGGGALLSWAWRGAALVPPDSGDAALVMQSEDFALVAVVDGLGHGLRAADAATTALTTVAANPTAELTSIVAMCHESLRGTRGAALTIARFDRGTSTLAWLGVGNIEARLWRADGTRERLVTAGGVVGYGSLRPNVWTTRIAAGDMYVVATDGLKSDFANHSPPSSDVREAAECLFATYARGIDDALVLVAHYSPSAV